MGEEKSIPAGLAALAALPKMLKNGPLDDLKTIAAHIKVLPELADLLATIEARVESLDDEVKKMRQAVEGMSGSVDALPPKIDELGHTLHPLRRMGSRFSRADGDDAASGEEKAET
jgi:hypothetical protein